MPALIHTLARKPSPLIHTVGFLALHRISVKSLGLHHLCIHHIFIIIYVFIIYAFIISAFIIHHLCAFIIFSFIIYVFIINLFIIHLYCHVLFQAVAPQMMDRHSGKIATLCSVNSYGTNPCAGAYCVCSSSRNPSAFLLLIHSCDCQHSCTLKVLLA